MKNRILILIVAALFQQTAIAGDWHVSDKRDEITDQVTLNVAKYSRDRLALLIVACTNKKISLTVTTVKPLWATSPVKTVYRFDQNPAVYSEWWSGKGTFIPFKDSERDMLLQSISKYHKFLFRVKSNTFKFDLKGFRTASQIFRDQCTL